VILLRDVAACYLIVTLAATGLAKLRRWRTASVVLVRDAVIPPAIVPGVVIAISLSEMVLSVFLTAGVELFLTEVAVAALLTTFGVYRMVAAANSKALACGCSGAIRSVRRTAQTVSATALGSAWQVAIALVLFATGTQHGGQWSALARISALLVPFMALIIGYTRGPGIPSTAEAHGSEHVTTAV
jgi:methylamine utilization protein MauE